MSYLFTFNKITWKFLYPLKFQKEILTFSLIFFRYYAVSFLLCPLLIINFLMEGRSPWPIFLIPILVRFLFSSSLTLLRLSISAFSAQLLSSLATVDIGFGGIKLNASSMLQSFPFTLNLNPLISDLIPLPSRYFLTILSFFSCLYTGDRSLVITIFFLSCNS